MSDEGVVILEGVAVATAQHLVEIGRLGSRSPRDVHAAIQSGVNTKWGTAKVPQFRDADGVGWVIDVSDNFGGEMLYAIVRRHNGEPCVIDVVTEDQLREVFPRKSKTPPPPPETAAVSEDSDSVADAEPSNIRAVRARVKQLEQQVERLNSELMVAKTVDPEGPALVMWTKTSMDNKDRKPQSFQEVVKVGEVGLKIQTLIDAGVKAEQITVWSQRKQPKLRIDLE